MAKLEDLTAQALARDPTKEAIEFKGRWYTWGEVRRVAERVGQLIEASGCHPRASVVLMPRTRPSAMAALGGLLATGRTTRMVYVYQKAPGILRDMDRLKPAVVIAATEDFTDEILAGLRERKIAAVGLSEMDAKAIAGFERSEADAFIETRPRPQLETLTSGTTGPPKQFPLDFDMIANYMVGSAGTEFKSATAVPEQEEPPFLHYAPLGNISGIYGTVPTLIKGRRAVMIERFTLKDWHDYIVRYRPKIAGMPAAGVQMILDSDIPREDLSSLTALTMGAAPLDPTVHRAFEERFGVPILLAYGATEFAGSAASMTPDLYKEWRDRKFGSVGRALPGMQLRVRDPDTNEILPPGKTGVLEVLCPKMNPDWIKTSDLALIDEDGFMFHRGRADGAINRGGFKLLPETIESALRLHPAVSDTLVVPVPDRRLGQVPGAIVQFKQGAQATIAELEAHLRDHVLATHIPTAWRFESIPRTPSMKADRGTARKLFEAENAA